MIGMVGTMPDFVHGLNPWRAGDCMVGKLRDKSTKRGYELGMLLTRSPGSLVGGMILSFVGILAYRWFGPIALVIVGGIGFPIVLAVSVYRFDLKTRKTREGPNPTDKGL
ncbi:MAG: hypothetical protein ABJB10_16345 [Mesorhizobium sp.]